MYSLVQAAPSDSFLGRFWFHRKMLDDLVKSEEATFEDPQDIMKKWYFMVVTQMQKSDKHATGRRWTIADRCFFCHILFKGWMSSDGTNQWSCRSIFGISSPWGRSQDKQHVISREFCQSWYPLKIRFVDLKKTQGLYGVLAYFLFRWSIVFFFSPKPFNSIFLEKVGDFGFATNTSVSLWGLEKEILNEDAEDLKRLDVQKVFGLSWWSKNANNCIDIVFLGGWVGHVF